jgi:putative transposase
MNLLSQSIQPQLWAYLAGIAKNRKMQALSVGGVENHLHILVNLPSTLSIAEALQVLKGNSSKWINDTFPSLRPFSWQEGYGSFSLGVSQMDATRRYIQRQAEHHRGKSFESEFLAFLKKHAIEYDPRHVFDAEITA